MTRRLVRNNPGELQLMDHLTITRCYAINGDIDENCPGSMCNSARLTQSNIPATQKNTGAEAWPPRDCCMLKDYFKLIL